MYVAMSRMGSSKGFWGPPEGACADFAAMVLENVLLVCAGDILCADRLEELF